MTSGKLNAACSHNIFLLLSVRGHGNQRRDGDHSPQPGAFRAGADSRLAGAGGAVLDALCPIRRRRANYSLRWRDHGAFLFVIMLVNIERSQKEEQFNKQWIVGIAAALALGVLFVVVYTKGKGLFPTTLAQLPETDNTQSIALLLYRDYMFAFEIASLLLLVAIIGAVVMAKKRI